MKKVRVLVIGGGPAGLIAAGQASIAGANVTIFEKMRDPGVKLCITGKGRCNITNSAKLKEFLGHFGPKKEAFFLMQAFSRFFNDELLIFFNDIGIPTKEERGGRIFPKCEDAKLVRNALVKWAKSVGVEIRCNEPVKSLELGMDRSLQGLMLKNEEFIRADKIILTTGGKSYPGTGSTGDGFALAGKIGHTIVKPKPGLVGLHSDKKLVIPLAGVSLRNVEASVFSKDKLLVKDFGEMLFTHTGFSGPIIITMSNIVVDALEKGLPLHLEIDFKPALDENKLDKRLIRDFETAGAKQIGNVMKGLLPKALTLPILIRAGISPDVKCAKISRENRLKLVNTLKAFTLPITGHTGFTDAIVTRGGIDKKEINPRTMQSKILDGLFFAGEVIDIDADTGGYNLQAAFSTGFLAGISVLLD